MKRTTPDKRLTILTNDPSLTAWGYAVVRGTKILETGCIKTAPEHKKRRIRKGDDTVRRVCEINEVLIRAIRTHGVNLLLSELPHGSQNAAAATMIGITTGVAQTLADCMGMAIEWYSEHDTKKFILGKQAATKKEMIDAVAQRIEVNWSGIKYRDEAVADALAVYLTACKQSQTLQLFNRL